MGRWGDGGVDARRPRWWSFPLSALVGWRTRAAGRQAALAVAGDDGTFWDKRRINNTTNNMSPSTRHYVKTGRMRNQLTSLARSLAPPLHRSHPNAPFTLHPNTQLCYIFFPSRSLSTFFFPFFNPPGQPTPPPPPVTSQLVRSSPSSWGTTAPQTRASREEGRPAPGWSWSC